MLVSNSQHSVGHLKTYSIRRQCQFDSEQYKFDKTDLIEWKIPKIHLQRLDLEMGCNLTIHISENISNNSALQWGVSDYWSTLCLCEGEVFIKGKSIKLKGWDDLNTQEPCIYRSYLYVFTHAKLLI